jgi:hypothetical protein
MGVHTAADVQDRLRTQHALFDDPYDALLLSDEETTVWEEGERCRALEAVRNDDVSESRRQACRYRLVATTLDSAASGRVENRDGTARDREAECPGRRGG